MNGFLLRYAALFRCARYGLVQRAYQYVCGLLQAETSNISQICETVMNANYEQMQHFITDSP